MFYSNIPPRNAGGTFCFEAAGHELLLDLKVALSRTPENLKDGGKVS